LAIVGEGPLRANLEELARKERVEVQFLGILPNDQLPELLNRQRGFIMPALFEGMPKALLEAMSCGLPVIGTDIPGICEVIQPGENGLLCAPEAASLRTAVEKLVASPGLERELAQGARATILRDHSLARAVDREWTLYRASI
jgi:glycosyltransferase involved in cell wall biosynthesis